MDARRHVPPLMKSVVVSLPSTAVLIRPVASIQDLAPYGIAVGAWTPGPELERL